MESLRGVKLIVFDLDGTIIRLKVDWNNLKNTLSLMFNKDFSTLTIALTNLPQNEKAKAISLMSDFETAELSEMEINEDIVNFIKTDKQHMFALFTHNSKATAEKVMEALDIKDKFYCTVAIDDLVHPKPHPEGLYKILELSDSPPSKALYVGDRDIDLEAGRTSGVRTMLIEEFTAYINK